MTKTYPLYKNQPGTSSVHVPAALGSVSVGYDQMLDPISGYYQVEPKKKKPKKNKIKKIYNSTSDLPKAVKNKLKGKPKKLRQWKDVFNSSFHRYHDEGRAFANAWAVVQKKTPNKAVLDIPLFIKLLEYARERAPDDETLHRIAERVIGEEQGDQALTMEDYQNLAKSLDSLECPDMVGIGGRYLEPYDDGTLFSPFKYDPSALIYLRPDQVPRFLDAITHPKRLPKTSVSINSLVAIKSRVGRDIVQGKLDKLSQDGKLKPPVVIAMNGECYIGDGHDRLAAMWLNGDDDVIVRFIDIEPYDDSKPDPNTDYEGSRYELLRGAPGRVMAGYKDGTASVPYAYDPVFFAHLRPDQVPKFLSAITHPEDLPEETLPLNSLTAIQNRINTETVAHYVEDPTYDPPVIIRLEGGRNYIGDGHDRLASAYLRGDDTAKVKVRDLSGPWTNTMKQAPEIPIQITKSDPEKGQVFGWASVVTKDGRLVIDKQGDIIPVDELEKAAYDYVVNSRDMGHLHERRGVGHMIESMVFTREKQDLLKIDLGLEGWWIGLQATDPQVRRDIKAGKLPEFSIGGFSIPKSL